MSRPKMFTEKDIELIVQCLKSGNFNSIKEISEHLYEKWNKSTVSSIYMKVREVSKQLEKVAYGEPMFKKPSVKLITLDGRTIEGVGNIQGDIIYKIENTYFFVQH